MSHADVGYRLSLASAGALTKHTHPENLVYTSTKIPYNLFLERISHMPEMVYLAALIRIRNLTTPGQTLTLQMAIDIICDVWNISDSAIKECHEKTQR
jgi:hypothetical protein